MSTSYCSTTQSLLWSLLRVTVRPEVVEVFPVTNSQTRPCTQREFIEYIIP